MQPHTKTWLKPGVPRLITPVPAAVEINKGTKKTKRKKPWNTQFRWCTECQASFVHFFCFLNEPASTDNSIVPGGHLRGLQHFLFACFWSNFSPFSPVHIFTRMDEIYNFKWVFILVGISWPHILYYGNHSCGHTGGVIQKRHKSSAVLQFFGQTTYVFITWLLS